jgi:superfamily I DNA/RNA helicase
MNTRRAITALTLTTLMTFAVGCEKKESTPTPEAPAGSATPNALSETAAKVQETAAQAATEIKETAARVTTEVKQTTSDATAAAADKVDNLKAEAQSLIDKTQALVTEKKYEDALNSLKQLSAFKLTAEQQKTVDDLKVQLQKLMTNSTVTNAASKLNSLLKN